LKVRWPRGQAVKSEDRRTDRIRNPEDNMTIDLEEQRTSGPRASADVG